MDVLCCYVVTCHLTTIPFAEYDAEELMQMKRLQRDGCTVKV